MKINCYKKRVIALVALLTACNSAFAISTHAADINLTVEHRSIDDKVTVFVKNDSLRDVTVDSVCIAVNGHKYPSAVSQLSLKSSQKLQVNFIVKLPALPGSYPLHVTVRYVNDGKILSLSHLGLFYFQEPAVLDASCSVKDASLRDTGDITVLSKQPKQWSLVLPEEIEALSSSVLPDRKVFHVRNNVTGFRVNYPVFAVAEKVSEGRHFAASCRGILHAEFKGGRKWRAGRMSSTLLPGLWVTFLLLSYFMAMRIKRETRLTTAVGKYASRMFLLFMAYYILKNIDLWSEYSLGFFEWGPYRAFVYKAIDNFRGLNYEYFFTYFVDIYVLFCFFFELPFLYYFHADVPIEEDKYASFVRSILSLSGLLKRKKPHWNKYSKLGFLTVCVKLFYIPLLVSWVINNTIHQKNLTATFQWDFAAINVYLVALFIYVDTIIFGFGYLVEFRSLKNTIKSVEPTLLGWIVCLWCYPPFNAFSFKMFDYRLFEFPRSYPGWIDPMITAVITVLWGVFVWASAALGFKASNLTNRGIVRHGPYRFVRHPAYAAKLMIWYIQGIFMSKFGLGILLGFTLIYVLRAWTEERHLSLDHDYRKYKKLVRWKYIPGLL